MAQGVLVGRYDGVDVVKCSESVNHLFGCLDGIVGEGPFVKSCWLLADILVTTFYACMHGRTARPDGGLTLWGACLLVHNNSGQGYNLRSSNAKTHPFQSFISLSVSRSALGAQMALM